MKLLKISLLLWGIVPNLLILLLLPSTASAGAASTGPGAQWKIISSPSPGSSSNSLVGVAVVSENNVWAVGGYTSGTNPGQALIEHWNGSKWSAVSSPAVGTDGASLSAVAAISAGNVWAAGAYATLDSSGMVVQRTLIEHWDGFTWTLVSSPNNGQSHNALNSLAVVSTSDIWAVGQFLNTGTGTYQTLTEHWNGTTWSIIPSPNPGTNNQFLQSVAASSSQDVWAVGSFISGNNPTRALIEHWNGASWSVVASPPSGTGGNYLNAVVALSAGDAWATGEGSGFASLVERWDGKQWKIVPNPFIATGVNIFNSLTAISAHNMWAAGYYFDSKGVIKTLIEHWNGVKWAIVFSPNPGSQENILAGLARDREHDAWSVGFSLNPNAPGQTLVEFHGGRG